MKKIFIHYGTENFSLEKFEDIKKKRKYCLNKPAYGLWASPVNTNWGWKDWCKSENYRIDSFGKSFRFRLKNGSKILTVRMIRDIEPFLKREANDPFYGRIQFSEIMKKYDGLELIHGDHYMELHDGPFYTWDCDSIVIWNPGVIDVMDK